ncbi:MAG: AmmeMemoRadiSam system protein B [Ignavibacteriales bacterium]|nr:AmmeMemoRadiSam system protein B [Ignavibacteriales bacterium]
MRRVRKPAVAGMFYPADAEELRTTVAGYLDATVDKTLNEIGGLIAPHAGYPYSGALAGKAYAALRPGAYDSVVVVSPSHRDYFQGVSIYDGDAYGTPLGEIPIHRELSDALVRADADIFYGDEGHRQEHALEVQLPFLQERLGSFELVAAVMGDQNAPSIDALADALAETIDDRTLVVASTDLSHFHSRADAEILDARFQERIDAFDVDGLISDLAEGVSEACGGGPAAAVMKALAKRGFRNALTIDRRDSAHATGDKREVVGYLSAAVYR